MRTATIIGAGVFGAWTAHTLAERGWRVTLADQHGPANSRASSGGETRIIRSGYGQAVYARWARESLADWLALELHSGQTLFHRTGALFLASDPTWIDDAAATLADEEIPHERLDGAALRRRFPQLGFAEPVSAVYEPEAGVLFARRAVQALVGLLVRRGVSYIQRSAHGPTEIAMSTADALVFACGPWLPFIFPDLLREMIVPTRQEVFFFGPPAGDPAYSPGRLPAWVAFGEGIYGLPDLEHRGVKIAIDAHGAHADPDAMERRVDPKSVMAMREMLRRHLPGLAGAPLLEARVCQYENTPDGHLLIDRLPGHDRVWIVGGGSGHGFKHGPAVGRYLADTIEELRTPDPIFALEGRPPRGRLVF